MKTHRIPVAILLCVISLQLTAQVAAPLNEQLTEKPSGFTALPEQFTISRLYLDQLFLGSSSAKVRLPIEHNKFLAGIVLERVQKNASIVTVNIRLSDYDEALFTISRRTTNSGAAEYTGRIINIRYADMMILKDDNQALYLVKEKQSLFLTE